MLALAAQIPSAELGTNYFQETQARHPVQGLQPLLRAGDPAGADSAPVAARDPHRVGTPGCVRVDDLRRRRAARGAGRRAGAGGRSVFSPRDRDAELRPADAELAKLARLADRRRQEITILAGAGCAGAHDQLVATAAALEAPIVHALRGKEHVEYDNPYDVGMTGLLGFASGYYAMMDCDLLLMLGTDFPVSAVLSAKGDRSRRWTCGRRTWAPRTVSTSAGRRRADDARPRCCRSSRESGSHTASTWTTRSPTIARHARALDELATGEPGSNADPPPVSHARGRRAGGSRTRSSPATSGCRRCGRRAI